MPITPALRVVPVLSLGLLLACAAGCSSEPGPAAGRGAHRKPAPPLAGQDTFFAGQILVQVNVGPENLPAGGPGGGQDGSAPRRNGGGRSHAGAGAGGFIMGADGGGGYRGHRDERGAEGPGGGGGERPEGSRPMMANLGPPVMIHLRFTNQGSGRVVLRIDDFSSPLGNFAVQPDKLILEAGQSLETEPMSSALTDALAETEATFVLRLGEQSEKKVVVLRTVPVEPRSETPAPPPGG